MADSVGWIGSICLAICGAPQAWACWRRGNAEGISRAFVGLWLGGEIFYVIGVAMRFGFVDWQMFNCGMNIVFASVIIYYLARGPASKKPRA